MFSFLLQFLLFVSRSKELSATSFNNLQVLIPLTYSQSLPVLGVISMLHISKKSLFGDEYCLYVHTVSLGLVVFFFYFSILYASWDDSFLRIWNVLSYSFLLLLSSEHRFLRVLALNLTELQCSLLSNSQTHSLMDFFKLVPLSQLSSFWEHFNC